MAHVDLLWLPLGAGGRSIRWNGRAYEAVAALRQRRPAAALFHSALEVHVAGDRWVVEMTPAWGSAAQDRGVVCEGPVGTRWLGPLRAFRYEVRRWRGGEVGDVAAAVAGPRRMSEDEATARRLLSLVADFPTCTWGRDEQATGEMWNSNSLTAWLLARTGHDVSRTAPPGRGRAPGWAAGIEVARRQAQATAADAAGRRSGCGTFGPAGPRPPGPQWAAQDPS